MRFAIHHGASSDVGRKRPRNEDCYLADPDRGLFVVCDGMGGGNAGEVASALAVETIRHHIMEAAANPALDWIGRWDDTVSAGANRLASAIRLANHKIYEAALQRAEWAGMGTTVVAVQVDDRRLSFAHVGDSRLYLIRNHTITPLTMDHSWVAEQVCQGFLTEDEAEQSPHRNIVTRAVGVEATVDVTVGELPLFVNDVLLLCSDGLTRDVPVSHILHHITDTVDVQALSERLVAYANAAGGEDNITALVLAVCRQADQGLWQRLRRRWAI